MYKQNINHVKLCGHLPRRHSIFDCLPFAVCHLSSLMSQVYINIFLWTSKAQHTNPHINIVKLIMMKRVNFGFEQPKYTNCKWCLCLFWDLPWCTNKRNKRKGFGLRILQPKWTYEFRNSKDNKMKSPVRIDDFYLLAVTVRLFHFVVEMRSDGMVFEKRCYFN